MATKNNVQTNLAQESNFERQLLDKWLPYMGCLSYGIYSIKMMQPRNFSNFFGASAARVEDTLWTVAGFGMAVFIYRQKCLRQASHPWRIIYSTFGSTFFNLGSNLLMWVTSEAWLRESHGAVKMLVGLSSGVGLVYVGWHFLTFLNSVTIPDNQVKYKHVEEESSS